MKTWLMALLVLVGGAMVYFFIFKEKESGYPKFNYPTKNLSKIFMANTKNQTVTLINVKDKWMLDGKYEVREDMIKRLLNDIEYQKTNLPLAASRKEVVTSQMKGAHVKVELYNINGENVKTFFVAVANEEGTGNYMLMNGDNTIYDVGVQNSTTNMTYDYMVNAEEWKSKWILDLKPENIAQVVINYNQMPENSFVLKNKNPIYTITGNPTINTASNQERLKDYLRFFEKLPMVNRANQNIEKDSLTAKSNQIGEVIVTSKNNTIDTLRLYYHPQTRRSKNLNGQVDKSIKDPDFLFVYIVKSKEFVLAEYLSFGRILRSYKEFFENNQGT